MFACKWLAFIKSSKASAGMNKSAIASACISLGGAKTYKLGNSSIGIKLKPIPPVELYQPQCNRYFYGKETWYHDLKTSKVSLFW